MKVFNKLTWPIRNGLWIFFLGLAIEAFLNKIPYAVNVGIFFIMLSFLTNPWFNKLLNRYDIVLTKKQKWFLVVSLFLVATYSVKPTENNYFSVIISTIIMITIWIMVIIYSKKNRK